MRSFCIIGLSCFGIALTNSLLEKGSQVMIISEDADAVNAMADMVTGAVIGDPTSEAVLRAAGVTDYDCAIVCIDDNMNDSILTTLILKELGVKEVIARAMNERHKMVLRRLGADQVVFPEEDMGDRLAQILVKKDVLDYYNFSDGISLAEIHIPKEWIGHTMNTNDLNLRRRYGVTVVAIRYGDGEPNVAPDPDRPFCGKDTLTIMGTDEKLDKILKELH